MRGESDFNEVGAGVMGDESRCHNREEATTGKTAPQEIYFETCMRPATTIGDNGGFGRKDFALSSPSALDIRATSARLFRARKKRRATLGIRIPL
ncbi:hypothetical protein FGB62_235g021 [Gracilaria domingensis]|nr:hypothetical protein FGB62_235g021 [Gracilaria domingensis]